MKLDENIKKIKVSNNLDGLKSIIDKLNFEWNIWEFRQKEYFEHENTKSIPLLWSTESTIFGGTIHVIEVQKYNSILYLLNEELLYLREKYNGFIIKVLVANLDKNKKIYPHIDRGFLLANSHRLHLPIKTNSEVIFNINKEDYHMDEGIWYEFDNTKMHYVSNNSNENRIHLMVDIIPENILIKNNLNVKIILE